MFGRRFDKTRYMVTWLYNAVNCTLQYITGYNWFTYNQATKTMSTTSTRWTYDSETKTLTFK